MSTGTWPIVDAKFTSKQKDFETPESTMCIYCIPLPTEFLQVYHNSTFLFLSYFTLLLPFLFMFHLPAVLILPCCFFALCLILYPSLLSQFPFPGFHSGSPSPRSSLGAIKGSRQLTESLLATRTKGNLLCYLTPPASSAKPLPPELPPFRPKRQRDKGKRVFEG